MDSKDERDARRAAALRANLRRRKDQARGQADVAVPEAAADGAAAKDVPGA
jgi:hypothetical protein